MLSIIIFGSCKLVDQPEIILSEEQLINKIQSQYKVKVERYYSQNYLRYKHHGSYTLRIVYNDSSIKNKLDSGTKKWVYYIDSSILKNNNLINEISFHLAKSFNNDSYEVVSYIVYKRDSLNNPLRLP